MRDLLILGTGVHAAEMAEIVERINRVAPTWNLLGYVAYDGQRAGEDFNGYPILGGRETIDERLDAALVPDYEWPKAHPLPRERVLSLIDPSAVVSRTATLGIGCVLYPGVFVGLNARLGDFVFALSGCRINHDDIIEDRVALASGVTLAGNLHIEADCYLGQSCSVRQFTRIGRGSLVGMGAVVIRDVPPGAVVVGNPARVLRSAGRDPVEMDLVEGEGVGETPAADREAPPFP